MQLTVEGMTCAHCERAIREAIAAVGGTAEIDLASGTVQVTGVDAATAGRAIEESGYKVKVMNTPSA